MTPSIEVVLLSTLFCFGSALASVDPEYEVESRMGRYEIRRYESTWVAETKIDSNFEDTSNEGVRVLTNYIFGNNKAKGQDASVKIQMTAPASQTMTSDGFFILFTLPRKYTIETIPEPLDSRIVLKRIPARNVAVFEYTGSWSDVSYQEKLKEFLSLLKKDGIKTIGEPEFARFNSPLQLWFLRRNEILINL